MCVEMGQRRIDLHCLITYPDTYKLHHFLMTVSGIGSFITLSMYQHSSRHDEEPVFEGITGNGKVTLIISLRKVD